MTKHIQISLDRPQDEGQILLAICLSPIPEFPGPENTEFPVLSDDYGWPLHQTRPFGVMCAGRYARGWMWLRLAPEGKEAIANALASWLKAGIYQIGQWAYMQETDDGE